MTTIKGTHSIQLNEISESWYEVVVLGTCLVACNTLEQALKFYQASYDRIYCVGMY